MTTPAHDEDCADCARAPNIARAFDEPAPLVSVVIPTWQRIDTLIGRAIPSALAQTYPNIEVIVVGDASPAATEEAITALGDPRVTFHNLTFRGPYSADAKRAWLAAGTPGFNAGVALASGAWIAPLGDDDAFIAEHVEQLLALARPRRLELAYGRIRMNGADGSSSTLGEFPLNWARSAFRRRSTTPGSATCCSSSSVTHYSASRTTGAW